MGSNTKFADELAAILRALNDHGQSSAYAIASLTGLPTAQVVDLIANHLGHAVEARFMRQPGTIGRSTLYKLKGA